MKINFHIVPIGLMDFLYHRLNFKVKFVILVGTIHNFMFLQKNNNENTKLISEFRFSHLRKIMYSVRDDNITFSLLHHNQT